MVLFCVPEIDLAKLFYQLLDRLCSLLSSSIIFLDYSRNLGAKSVQNDHLSVKYVVAQKHNYVKWKKLPCCEKFRNFFLTAGMPDVFAYLFGWICLSNACKSWLPRFKNWIQDKQHCFAAQIHCENGIKFTSCSKVSQKLFTAWNT